MEAHCLSESHGYPGLGCVAFKANPPTEKKRISYNVIDLFSIYNIFKQIINENVLI